MVLNDLGQDLADVTPEVTIHLLFLFQSSHDLKSESRNLVIKITITITNHTKLVLTTFWKRPRKL